LNFFGSDTEPEIENFPPPPSILGSRAIPAQTAPRTLSYALRDLTHHYYARLATTHWVLRARPPAKRRN